MNKAIILTAFGDRRKNLKRIIHNIKEYQPDLPIYLYTDEQCNCSEDINCVLLQGEQIKWKYHKHRYGFRMSDYWRIQSMFDLQDQYDMFLYMDDDMFIIHPDFFTIFDFAELFETFVLIASPRHYMGYDAKRGMDSPFLIPDKYYKAFGYNSGIVCVYMNNPKVIEYLKVYIDIMERTPGRGPVIFWEAARRTKYFPYVLQEEWMVTGLAAERIYLQKDRYPPLCLHWSDRNTRSMFDA